jgi:hypothetical protein
MSISGGDFKFRALPAAALTISGLSAGLPFVDASTLFGKAVTDTLTYEQPFMVKATSGTSHLGSLEAPVKDALIAQRTYLLGLPNDWDGYGAEPIQPGTIDALYSDLVIGLKGTACFPPDIIPGSDGSVQAEWHLAGLKLFYNVGSDRSRYMAVLRDNQSPLEFFGKDAQDALARWSEHLVSDQSIGQSFALWSQSMGQSDIALVA